MRQIQVLCLCLPTFPLCTFPRRSFTHCESLPLLMRTGAKQSYSTQLLIYAELQMENLGLTEWNLKFSIRTPILFEPTRTKVQRDERERASSANIKRKELSEERSKETRGVKVRRTSVATSLFLFWTMNSCRFFLLASF